MLPKVIRLALILLVGFGVIALKACRPISSFMEKSSPNNAQDFLLNYPIPKSTTKTIILIADNKGTEIFDLLAPFHMLKAATNANVFIVAKTANQIPLHRGVSILPHHTFQSFNELNIQPDAIVIPNLSTIVPEDIDSDILDFIKTHYSEDMFLLSVCDGAATAACTGLFNGRQMIAHASDMPYLKKAFPKVDWVKNQKYVVSDNLITTAGVSNATEGTLVLIEKLFGKTMAFNAMQKINYPSNTILNTHQSKPITFSDKLTIFSKVALKKNKTIGLLLEDGLSEFKLAGVLDTYSRTFPKSISTSTYNLEPVKSEYGLTLYPTASTNKFDVLLCFSCDTTKKFPFDYHELKNIEIEGKKYVFDKMLNKYISNEYNDSFTSVVAKLLDYNFNP